MYSRPSSREFRVPSNYGGNAFRDNTPTQAQDLTRRQVQYRREEQPRQTQEEVPVEALSSEEAARDAYFEERGENECCERVGNCERCSERKEKVCEGFAEKKD